MNIEAGNDYGVNFPSPAKMGERTKSNQYFEIQTELLNLIEQMEKATTYSIKLNKLSLAAQEILLNLGYEVIANTDQGGYILSYEISWENKEENK